MEKVKKVEEAENEEGGEGVFGTECVLLKIYSSILSNSSSLNRSD